ncbi:MAG TPA: hypothetical protein VJ257_02230 [Solirubrobacterales bacterium]|jgi:hypothetical protein|nr:hypothetical protein [Solirubrobacterales bacterium]
MAATSSSGKSTKTQAKRTATDAKRTATDAKRTAGSTSRTAKVAAPEKNQVQSVAETAVDLPVGVVLSVTDRVSELFEPWTGRDGAEKQVKAYRAQLRKSLKRTERRGATARRKATTEAKKAIDEQTSRAQDLVDQVTEQLSALR